MAIEDRTAAREEELRSRMEDSRRLARPEDYVWDKAQEAYWDLRDGTLHGDRAVDGSIPLEYWRVTVEEGEAAAGAGRPKKRKEQLIKPSQDIMRIEFDRTVEGSTWWPGMPQLIKDWFVDKDGFYPAKGRRIYNQYKAPPTVVANGDAKPWIDHVRALWPDESEFFFDYCAHMIQRPHEKCNTAIVMSGAQGIGKDAALKPVKSAVGSWNIKNIDPDELFSPYKPWLQTLMLIIDEVRPSKDEFHASSMYNILKPLIAAPPDTLPLNDKYQKLRHIINVMRVFITTNDWMAMYVPAEDRRMFVMHSIQPQKWKDSRYFIDLFGWFESGGDAEVAAWLMKRDISSFNPKAQSEKTLGWNAVANTWGEPEDAVGQALDILGKPDIVFGSELLWVQFDGADDVAGALKSPRKIGHRMHRSGYISVRNPKGDKWIFKGPDKNFKSGLVFVKQELLVGGENFLVDIENRGKKLVGL